MCAAHSTHVLPRTLTEHRHKSLSGDVRSFWCLQPITSCAPLTPFFGNEFEKSILGRPGLVVVFDPLSILCWEVLLGNFVQSCHGGLALRPELRSVGCSATPRLMVHDFCTCLPHSTVVGGTLQRHSRTLSLHSLGRSLRARATSKLLPPRM